MPVVMGRVVCCLDILVAPICNAVDVVVRDGLQEQLTINVNRIQSSSRKVDDSDDNRIHIKDQD